MWLRRLAGLTAIKVLRVQAASLLLYQSVFAPEAGQAFLSLLDAVCQQQQDLQLLHLTDALRAYGRWFRSLATDRHSWRTYVIAQILHSDNPFTQQVQDTDLQDLAPALVAAARHDLQVLQGVAESGDRLYQALQPLLPQPLTLVAETLEPLLVLPTLFDGQEDWAGALPDLIAHYQEHGTGLFAQYRAFSWQSGQLVGHAHPDPITMAELVGYETQREQLVRNTEALLAGDPALNVLLYGSRGSGKSALIKSLLTVYGDQGLRLLEVAKSDLQALPQIMERLRSVPHKFVIFVDDLSFEADEETYKALKVVLEGGLTARPPHLVVYATSNRRHLIREFFGDRPRPSASDEIHAWDTVQEKLSLSDRFGLTLTFEPADQPTYLTIVHHLAQRAGITLDTTELEHQALQWATRHNGRSGRTARQFIDALQAKLVMAPATPDT